MTIVHNMLIAKVDLANDDTNGSKDTDLLEESLAKEPVKGKENVSCFWQLECNQ